MRGQPGPDVRVGVPAPLPEGAGSARTESSAEGAVFSPFASIGVASPPAAISPPPAIEQGDWGMPAVAAVLGIVCIGAMLRKLVS